MAIVWAPLPFISYSPRSVSQHAHLALLSSLAGFSPSSATWESPTLAAISTILPGPFVSTYAELMSEWSALFSILSAIQFNHMLCGPPARYLSLFPLAEPAAWDAAVGETNAIFAQKTVQPITCCHLIFP